MAPPILKLSGRGPSKGNPRFCNACEVWARNHPGGAEIELTLLFADVRGSTRLAEDLRPREFAALMQRFYRASTEVLIDSDAFLDKPIGDEIVALYFPAVRGADHAAKGLRAAQNLLIGTGPRRCRWSVDPDRCRSSHRGRVFVGTVGVEGTDSYDVTALGGRGQCHLPACVLGPDR